MDQYVSCCLPAEELNLDTIWGKFKEFCKPRLNEVIVHFDLLTSFRQGNRSVEYGTMQCKLKSIWQNTPQKQPGSCTETSSGSSCMMRNLFQKPLMMGMWNLDKFTVRHKVRQLAKRMESSKVTTCHIKQVAGDPQAAQINLLRHQCTELPAGNTRKRSPLSSQDNQTTRIMVMRILKCQASTRNCLMSRMPTRTKSGVQSVEIQLM